MAARKVFQPQRWVSSSRKTTADRVYDEGAKGRWWGSYHIKRGGGKLEMMKFAIYLSIPVTASYVYSVSSFSLFCLTVIS
jgi:hypothetical protein